MLISTIIEEEIKRFLLENVETKDGKIGMSLRGLIEINGLYKSEKQKKFLLMNITSPNNKTHTYCERLYFGQHQGASAQVCYKFKLDNIGLVSYTKWTQKQGDKLMWIRTEEMEREAHKKIAYWEFQKKLKKEVEDKKEEYFAFEEKTINELSKLGKTKENFQKYLTEYGLKTIGIYNDDGSIKFTDNVNELLEQIRKTEEILDQIPELKKGVDAMKIMYEFINSETYRMYVQYYSYNISPQYHELNKELKPEYKKMFS